MSRVGQFLGKLFAGNAGKNETPLRAYGKLPYYAEYRRLEVAPGAPTAFTQWMDAGRLAWVRAVAGGPPGTVRPSRVMIQLPGSKELVVASVWDSRDNLGRIFPFSFFAVCPPDALGADASERWVAAQAIYTNFERYHRELSALSAGGDFYRLFRNRMIVLRPDDLPERGRQLHAEVTAISTQDWFNAAGFGDDVPPADWFAAMQRRVERWRGQPEAVNELAVSCPVAKGYSSGAQVALWLSLIGRLAGGAGRPVGLVAPADDSHAIHFLVRDPLPDDFQLLTSDAGGYNYVENLGRLPASPSSGEAAAAPPNGPMLAWLANHATPSK